MYPLNLRTAVISTFNNFNRRRGVIQQLLTRSSHTQIMTTPSSTNDSTQRLFQLKLNPLTGESEWFVIQDNDVDDDDVHQGFDGSRKPLLATTSYLDMLNDSRRNRAFREAIDKAVKGKACHVLDIGAGTGLLSMMAARGMSSADSTEGASMKGSVTACESYLPMVKLMRKVMRINGMERKIKVFNKRSDELKVGVDIPLRADVLVSEILDSELLGEGLIPTLQHAHDMLLVENPQTVPYRATTYCQVHRLASKFVVVGPQLVESTCLWKLHDLFHNEELALDGIHLVPAGLESILGAKHQQYALHCDSIQGDIRLLSEPLKVFEFDFWKRPNSHGETKLRIKATNNGKVNALVSWWVLQLDREGTIFYSTAPKWIDCPYNKTEIRKSQPGSSDWCDHWKQCVWFVSGNGLPITRDEDVYLQANHTDTGISYNIGIHARETENLRHHNNDIGCQLTISPERVAIYGDGEWRKSMKTAFRKAVQGKQFSLCLVADDSIFFSILAAQHPEISQIISLFSGIREKGKNYLQAVAHANGFSKERVGVFGKRTPCFTKQDTNQKENSLKTSMNPREILESALPNEKLVRACFSWMGSEYHAKLVDLLIGEPFYYGCDGGLPWQNLRFWKERTMLNSFLSKDVVIMPCKGVLRGCAMSLPDLWSSLRCLDKIEGFDHAVVNSTLGAVGNSPESPQGHCLPFFVWQCGEIKVLSKVFNVMEFDFLKPISSCDGKVKVEFTNRGTCHGFVFWIDWVMDREGSIIISTGPDHRYHKQAVKLLETPHEVPVEAFNSEAGNCPNTIDASFDPYIGDVSILATYSH